MEGDILDDPSVAHRVRRLIKTYRGKYERQRASAERKYASGEDGINWAMVTLYRRVIDALEWAIGEGDGREEAYPRLNEWDAEADRPQRSSENRRGR